MANLQIYKSKDGKKSTFQLDPKSYYEALKDPFELKELESLRLIKAHIQEFKRPVVMTSHGKDSLVVVHLAWRACQELGVPMIEVWLNNTLNLYAEEKPFWDLFNKWLGIEDKFRVFTPPKLPNGKQATVWSIAEFFQEMPYFRHLARSGKKYKHGNIPRCCDWLKKRSIKIFMKSLPKDERVDCKIMGTRGQESLNRRVTLLQRCRSYFVKTREAYPLRVVQPIGFWTTADVWQYFDVHKMPKNPTYSVHNLKRMGCASCPAYIGWEIEQAKDPSRHAMLKENLKRMKQYGQLDRYNEAIENLKKHRLMPELWNQNTLEAFT